MLWLTARATCALTRALVCLLLVGLLVLAPTGLALAQDDQPPDDQASADPNQPWWLWTSSPDPATQISAEVAYDRFWQVRTEIMAAPDADAELNASLALDGPALQRELDVIHQLRGDGQAEVIRVEHHPTVMYADDQQYVIYDDYVNSTYLIDAKSKAPLGDGPNTEPSASHYAYWLKKTPEPRNPLGYLVKVVDSVRLDNR